MTKTIGYTIIDTITGAALGVWHSVSERGAKQRAAKTLHTEYRYLAAVPFVPVEELETTAQEDDGFSWVEVEYGDESDHWTEKVSTEGSLTKAMDKAREYIAAGYGNRVSVVKLVAIPETVTVYGVTVPAVEFDDAAAAETLADWEQTLRAESETTIQDVANVSRETLTAPEGFTEVWELFDAVSAVTIFEGSESDVKALYGTYEKLVQRVSWNALSTEFPRIALDYDRKELAHVHSRRTQTDTRGNDLGSWCAVCGDDMGTPAPADETYLTYNHGEGTVTYSDGRTVLAHPSFIQWINAE